MHWGFVIAGWGVTGVTIAVYAFALIRRGKALSAKVPAERRRYVG